jgi:hypothetical protein
MVKRLISALVILTCFSSLLFVPGVNAADYDHGVSVSGSATVGITLTRDQVFSQYHSAVGAVAELCAAFNRGVALNTSSWYTPAAYYGTSIKNDFSKFFHQIGVGNRAYGFAYDDINDQSSVKILPSANPSTSLTIGIGW